MELMIDDDDLVIASSDEDDDPESAIGEPIDYNLGASSETRAVDDTPETSGQHTQAAHVHLAPVLRSLRDEINTRWPRRDRSSDGWIGDTAHQARKSDHNPDGDGSVNALDIDRDGIDPWAVVRTCIVHPSTEYVIFDRTIWSRSRGFNPARYTGSNPHTKHIHVSVGHTSARENSSRGWGIAARSPKLGDRRLRVGSRGTDVQELQAIANKLGGHLAVDGHFGPRTEAWVRSFQRSKKLTVDGIVGPATVAALRSATRSTPPSQPGHRPGSRTLRRGMSGDDVAFVQRFIGERKCGKDTGIFDSRTEDGVRWYQNLRGLTPDGIVGPLTWREMHVIAS